MRNRRPLTPRPPTTPSTEANHTPPRLLAFGSLGATALLVAGFTVSASPASAAATEVDLATAASYSVLAGSTVTNTGTSTIAGDLGVSPGTAVTGQSSLVVGGVTHLGDAAAGTAQADLTAAYTNAAGQTPPVDADPELGGETLVGGVYNRATAMALNGQLILDGANNPDSVWVFQAGTTLITGSASSVVLINGADPCNVFWQVGSSATLGTTTTFVGTIMADQSIGLKTGATLQGRALARIGAVTLESNVITNPVCTTLVEAPVEAPVETPVDATPVEAPVETPVDATPVDATPERDESSVRAPDGSRAGGTPSGGSTGGTPNTPNTRTTRVTTADADNPGAPTVPDGHPRTGLGGTAPVNGPGVPLVLLTGLLAAAALLAAPRSGLAAPKR